MSARPRAYSPTVEGLSRKALSGFEWKSEKTGAFRAVVATYNVVDKDGDVSIPGALDTQKSVLVSPWNHSSVDDARNDPPVGAATITTVGDKAIAEGHFYVNTDLGRKAYEITKSLFQDGLGEWSYAFRIPQGGAMTDAKSLEDWPGAQRILAKVLPFEVSLVFAGAGEGTRTLSLKSALESKVGARLSKESRTRLRSLATDLLAFIGEAELDETDPPKSRHDDAELQAFLRRTRDDMERTRRSALVDLRLV
jgi:hypothetical protein